MKHFIAGLIMALAVYTGGVAYATDLQDSVGALYSRNAGNDLSFTCTVTAITSEGDYVVVLTARHCINEKQKHYLVTFNNMVFFNAELYKIPREHPDDPTSIDIALLRIKSANVPLIDIGASLSVKVGEDTVTVGFPNGMAKLLAFGYVAGRIDNPSDSHHNYLLVQTSASYGSSGTSVIQKSTGKVIGILVAMTTQGTPIFFVTPIEYMKYLVTPAEKRKVQRENKG